MMPNMKLSFAISYQQTSFTAIGTEDFDESLKLMKSFGFNGVEIGLRNPEQIKVSALKGILDKNDMKLVAIGTGQAYVDEGISLTDFDSQVRDSAVSRIKNHIDLASIFNSQVIIGLIRGIIDKSNPVKQLDFFKNSMLELCSYAEKKQVMITVEPLNRYECNFLNTADDVIQIIRELDVINLKVLLDTFHMNIEEMDIQKTIIETKNYLSHVHIADSNRRYPGMGHMNFNKICDVLKENRYKGFLSGEMLPFPDLKTAMKQYIIRMKEIANA